MNNRARHMQYRKSIYRKKRIKAIVILSALALAVLFVLFLIIGTALHNKTSEDSQSKGSNKDKASSTEAATDTLPEAKAIGGYALPLLLDGSNFSERLAAIPNDAGAVCIALNSTDGTLLYRSALSTELSYLKYASDASNISNAMSRIKERELYASALLYVPSFAEENDLLRDVYLTSWCSVAVEALRAGAGDCLLVPRSVDKEDVEKICTIAELIHEIEPQAVIGCLLPESVISAENNEVLVARLDKCFNYLALDTTDYKADEDVNAYVEARISQMQMQLIYYKMRVLLPYSSDSQTQQEYIGIAKKYNISSWVVKP